MQRKNLKILLAKRLVKDIFANLGDLCALMAKGPLPMRKASEWQNPDFFATPPASHVQKVQEPKAAQAAQDAQDAQAVAQPQKAPRSQKAPQTQDISKNSYFMASRTLRDYSIFNELL